MPPSEPVAELITQNIVSTLDAITAGDDYWTTVRHAQVGDASMVGEHRTPAAFVRANDTDMDGEGETVTGGIRHSALYTIQLVLESRDANAATQMERFARDAMQALYVDRSRGGYATKTIVSGLRRTYPDGEQQDTYIPTLTVRVEFRTSATDLGSAF